MFSTPVSMSISPAISSFVYIPIFHVYLASNVPPPGSYVSNTAFPYIFQRYGDENGGAPKDMEGGETVSHSSASPLGFEDTVTLSKKVHMINGQSDTVRIIQ